MNAQPMPMTVTIMPLVPMTPVHLVALATPAGTVLDRSVMISMNVTTVLLPVPILLFASILTVFTAAHVPLVSAVMVLVMELVVSILMNVSKVAVTVILMPHALIQ